MSALERASSQKKKQDNDRRRLSAVNMVLAGSGSGDSSASREESGEKSVTSAMSNLTVHQAGERGDREREREKPHVSHHSPNPSISTPTGSLQGQSAGGKDVFLSYFFGGPQQRVDRPAVQEHVHRPPGHVHNVAKEMIMPKTVVDGEPLDHERRMDHVTDTEEYINLDDREGMEIQLIRKCPIFNLWGNLSKPWGKPCIGLMNRWIDPSSVFYFCIGSLIVSYFNITRKSTQDLVPKAVMHLLVNYSRETVQNRLVAALYKEDLFTDLLQEDDNLAAERAKCKAMLDVFKNAFSIINESM